jgi:hypothetical protein
MRPQSRQQQQQEESAGRARSREAETAAALEAELATLRARLGVRMAQSEPHVLAALTIQGRCGGVGHVFCRRSPPYDLDAPLCDHPCVSLLSCFARVRKENKNGNWERLWVRGEIMGLITIRTD